MSGSVFSTFLVIGVGLAFVAITGAAALWMLPVAVVGLLMLLLLGPGLGALKGRSSAVGQPHGVPTTTQASYDPTREAGR